MGYKSSVRERNLVQRFRDAFTALVKRSIARTPGTEPVPTTIPEAPSAPETPVVAPAARPRRPLDSAQDIAWHYDTYLGDYRAVYGEILQAHRPTDVEELLRYEMESAGLADGMRVLDAGCGFCGPAIWFAQRRDITVDGITLGTDMAEAARRAVAAARLSDRITVREGDFHHLSDLFPEKTFDRVLFLETIGYFRSLDQVLNGAYHVLKPGGAIYVKDWYVKDHAPGTEEFEIAEQLNRKVYEEYGYNNIRRIEIVEAVLRAGFEIVTEQVLPIDINPEIMFGFDARVGNTWPQYIRNNIVYTIPYELLARRA
ncbi:MAG: methyltransferase domain-containing protein [Capsulimonadales bacterium]|nr:methyltransferase domain-containing protein [Capsulimonadales bacterium]